MSDRESALLRLLARSAQRLGAVRVSLATSESCVRALISAGARLTRRVVQYKDEAPYVLEHAELRLGDITVTAHRPSRPATGAESLALTTDKAYFHLGEYRAVDTSPTTSRKPPPPPNRRRPRQSDRPNRKRPRKER